MIKKIQNFSYSEKRDNVVSHNMWSFLDTDESIWVDLREDIIQNIWFGDRINKLYEEKTSRPLTMDEIQTYRSALQI